MKTLRFLLSLWFITVHKYTSYALGIQDSLLGVLFSHIYIFFFFASWQVWSHPPESLHTALLCSYRLDRQRSILRHTRLDGISAGRNVEKQYFMWRLSAREMFLNSHVGSPQWNIHTNMSYTHTRTPRWTMRPSSFVAVGHVSSCPTLDNYCHSCHENNKTVSYFNFSSPLKNYL